MSDVNQAPPPSPPQSAPAPAQGEVPVNPNPINAPSPIGSQAPPKPPHEVSSPAQARRDSVAEAFRKSRDPEWQKNRPGPAKAGKGHNQPPEPTPQERRAQNSQKFAPLDLKRRPDDQPGGAGGTSVHPSSGAQAPPLRTRGDGGRFAPAATAGTVGANPPPRQGGSRPSQPNPLPPHAPYREPVRGMSPRASADWHAAPESVRGDMHRMHHEFRQAANRLHADHAAMKAIRPYHDLAVQQGTTLDRVLNNFTSIEHKLRNDPIGGLDLIVNNLNLQASDGRRLGLRDIAWHVVNQTPEQLQLMQGGNALAAQAAQLAQMRQEQAALAQHLQQMHYQQRFTQERGTVDRFAETHPRLDELGPIIERELRLGFDLPTAYRRAELLQPATHAAETRNANQQRPQPDRSIRGAPESGTNGAARARPRSANSREAVARSIAAMRGAV